MKRVDSSSADETRLPSTLEVWRRPEHRKMALALFLFSTCVYFLTAPGRIDIVDGAIRFDVTHNLIELGRPLVTHKLPAVQMPNLDFYAFYQVGTSILAMPFVLLARWLAPGSINAEQFAFTFTTVPFAGALASLVYLTWVRLGLSFERARNWALLHAFGSLLWVYAGSSFDLAPQAFFLFLGIVFGAEALTTSSRGCGVLSGLGFFGLATTQETYLPLSVFVLCAIPWEKPGAMLRSVFRRLRHPALLYSAFGVILGLASVFLYNYARFGDPFSTGRETVTHPLVGRPLQGLRGLLFSPAKSIFLYSPLHVLGLVGLVRSLRSRSEVVLPLLGIFLGQVALVSTLAFWAGEWAWGPRYLVATSPLVILGAPFAFEAGKRWTLRIVAAIAVVIQLLSISVDHQLYYADKNFLPFFWLHDEFMYSDSPLFRRPQELARVLGSNGYEPGMRLVPGVFDPPPEMFPSRLPGAPPEPPWVRARENLLRWPRVVTSSNMLPPLEIRQAHRAWARDYYVFNAPRPWVLWASGIPREMRPVPVVPWALLGFVGALASAFVLFRTRKESVG